MRIFFTADLHIGHANILHFTSRKTKYKTIEEHDNAIIAHWNKQVKQNDHVYVVGDFIWSTVKNPAEIIRRLNGYIHLIVGNHDKITLHQGLNYGLASVSYTARIKIGKQFVNISHYPYRFGFWKNVWEFLKNPRKLKLMLRPILKTYPKNDGGFLIHGHTHSKNQQDGRMIHVGWDAWGRLISLDEIVNVINKG